MSSSRKLINLSYNLDLLLSLGYQVDMKTPFIILYEDEERIIFGELF
jgi:hypothetical protein